MTLNHFTPSASPVHAKGPSPFLALGRDICERIMFHICYQGFHQTTISTDGVRLLLPFALVCTSHYTLFSVVVRRLKVDNLGSTSCGEFAALSSSRHVPVPFDALFNDDPYLPMYGPLPLWFPPLEIDVKALGGPFSLFSGLVELHLCRLRGVSDDTLYLVASCLQNLRELRVRENHQITVNGLFAVATSCNRLTALSIRGCKQIGDETGPVLRSMSSLSYLDLSGLDVTDTFVSNVAMIPTLSTLFLQGCYFLGSDACHALGCSATFLEHLNLSYSFGLCGHSVCQLTGCTHLRSLDLSYLAFVTDESVSEFGNYDKMPALESLVLSNCHQITDEGVVALARNKSIQHLDFMYCELLSDACAEAIGEMESLKHVSLLGCKDLTDKAIIAIARLSSLEIIAIARCVELTDLSANALADSPSSPLQEITAYNCDGISPEGKVLLRQACKTFRG